MTIAGADEGGPKFRTACRDLGLAAAALKKVKRPAFLAEPHAVLAAAWRDEAIACAALARNFADDFAVSEYETRVEQDRADERHWRTEITVQLRRLGLVVPKWVRTLGSAPIATE